MTFPSLKCNKNVVEMNTITVTHFFKSNTVILFPTGLMTAFPSGVKRRSPL